MPHLLAGTNHKLNIKLVESRPFNGNTTQAQSWFFALNCYFIAVGITYMATEAADTEAVC